MVVVGAKTTYGIFSFCARISTKWEELSIDYMRRSHSPRATAVYFPVSNRGREMEIFYVNFHPVFC